MSLAPIAAVEYLEAACPFASDHGFGMAIAQLDLTSRTPRCIDLPENYRRTVRDASLPRGAHPAATQRVRSRASDEGCNRASQSD